MSGLSSEAESDLLSGVRRVVVLGDSITYGGGYVAAIEAYALTRHPSRQIEWLNLGLPSETVSGLSEPGHADGQFPRPDLHERLDRVLAETKPDLVVACYGMNDGIYYPFGQERFARFQDGLRRLHVRVLARGARLLHVTPPPFDPEPIQDRTLPSGLDEYRRPFIGYNQVLDRYSDWLLAQRSHGWEVADVHGPLNRHLSARRAREPAYRLADDGVHIGATGHWIAAREILLALGGPGDIASLETTDAMLEGHPRGAELFKLIAERQALLKDAMLTAIGHARPGMPRGFPLAEAERRAAALDVQIRALAPPFPGQRTRWQGFDRYDFEFAGKPAIVVVPREPRPGRPWAWRGEFFGAFANADIELVSRGFHLAYLGVPDLFGSPAAVAAWTAFHEVLTTEYKLAGKVALIGLSRGGLYCYNWAAANPDKVSCIYADAAVCDFKSWPGGKVKGLGRGDGSAAEWEKLLKAYGFQSDAEAVAYRGNPVDSLRPLAEARIPLLHVYGDADTVVPADENTGVVATRYRELGGSITLIPKPGVGHHPHGLADPMTIVDFIIEHAGRP
ncbi:MAG TPA: GDSL-type esterase/lipase family protein [Candidatus Paceibacterota bacterium]|nr:GDSL-type esterase/lipase family protein [Candidatus Paceibacterota bacterium]